MIDYMELFRAIVFASAVTLLFIMSIDMVTPVD
jgi:hypothetical protein